MLFKYRSETNIELLSSQSQAAPTTVQSQTPIQNLFASLSVLAQETIPLVEPLRLNSFPAAQAFPFVVCTAV